MADVESGLREVLEPRLDRRIVSAVATIERGTTFVCGVVDIEGFGYKPFMGMLTPTRFVVTSLGGGTDERLKRLCREIGAF